MNKTVYGVPLDRFLEVCDLLNEEHTLELPSEF